MVARGVKRTAQFSWQSTRAAYREFLLTAAPDVFGAAAVASAPTVVLAQALEEFRSGAPENGLLTAAPLVDINVHLRYMEALLQEEHQSALGRIPVLGVLVRAIIRLRNIGRFWRSSSAVAGEIVRRQALLAAKIEASTRSEDSRARYPVGTFSPDC